MLKRFDQAEAILSALMILVLMADRVLFVHAEK
jgi:hypothetical protein